ncbi:MAG: hypothetical protein HRU21_10345 [Pseudomonadales bacterium]|nr:hypothetical protein [Pseudomonadales bacterium]|tara:strand:- start:227 stop:460 length:234 start_codon:yes stop_codon:yes gene_type:complete
MNEAGINNADAKAVHPAFVTNGTTSTVLTGFAWFSTLTATKHVTPKLSRQMQGGTTQDTPSPKATEKDASGANLSPN